MSGFYASDTSTTAAMFAIDDFYPALSLADFRKCYRVDNSYVDEAVTRVITDAVVDVTDDLAAFRSSAEADGYNTLDSVPSPHIGDRTRLDILFEKAVFCRAKASLVDTFRDVDTSPNFGNDRANDEELSSDYWRRESSSAISKMIKQPTVYAILI